MLETTSGVIILLTLAFLGLYIFRPLANTLLKERAQLERANQELSFLSSVDGLTGIPNRRCFDQFLSRLWSLGARNGEPIALIMCDIDFFKAYNDTYGHLQGDECLKKVAETLRANVENMAIPHRLSSITPKVTISLGVAIGYANSAVLPQTLIESADNALYQAKQDGRNRYNLANDSH